MLNANTIKTLLGKGGLILKKHSPEILTVVGIAGMIGTTVMASRATLKLNPILEDIKDAKSNAVATAEEEVLQTGTYDKKRYSKAVTKVYLDGAVDISKLYGATITLGLSSVACLIVAQGIMKRRVVALAAAYKTLEASFSEYRKRVIDAIGEDKEEDIRLGRKTVEIVDEKGKTKKVTTLDPIGTSPYAKFFDEYSQNWSKTPEYNLLFLRAQQNHANDLLRARGHVFLNEVYDMLDIPRTQAGQVVGWLLSDEGDDFIDFGIYDLDNKNGHMFVNGLERSILLDFNVDGIIYDKL